MLALALLLLKPPDTDFAAMAVSGNMIVTVGAYSGRLWDARTGRMLRILTSPGVAEDHNDDLEHVVFSFDGKRILGGVSAPDGGWSPVWDLSGRLLFQITGSQGGALEFPLFSGNGRQIMGNLTTPYNFGLALFSGNNGGVVREWKPPSPEDGSPQPLCSGPTAEGFLAMNDNNLLYLPNPSASKWKWLGTLLGNYTPGDKYGMFDDKHHRLIGIWHDHEGEHVVTAHIGTDGRLGRQTISRFAFPASDFRSNIYSPHSDQLILGDVSGHVYFVDVASGKLLRTLNVSQNPVVDFGFTTGEKLLVVATRNWGGDREPAKLTIWSVPKLKLVRTIKLGKY